MGESAKERGGYGYLSNPRLEMTAEQQADLARMQAKLEADAKRAERQRIHDEFTQAALTGLCASSEGSNEVIACRARCIADECLRQREAAAKEKP